MRIHFTPPKPGNGQEGRPDDSPSDEERVLETQSEPSEIARLRTEVSIAVDFLMQIRKMNLPVPPEFESLRLNGISNNARLIEDPRECSTNLLNVLHEFFRVHQPGMLESIRVLLRNNTTREKVIEALRVTPQEKPTLASLIVAGKFSTESFSHPDDAQAESISRLWGQLSLPKLIDSIQAGTLTRDEVQRFHAQGCLYSPPESKEEILRVRDDHFVFPIQDDPSGDILGFVRVRRWNDPTTQQDRFGFQGYDPASVFEDQKGFVTDMTTGAADSSVMRETAELKRIVTNRAAREKVPFRQIGCALELRAFYKLFNDPEIKRVVISVTNYPYDNDRSVSVQRHQLCAKQICLKASKIPNANLAGLPAEVKWVIMQFEPFTILAQKYPNRDLTFEQFVEEYLKLVYQH